MTGRLRDQSGVALVMVLVISAIALAVMSALIYMLTAGTQISGMQKRYKTALEAAQGGESVMFEYIGTRGDPDVPGIGLAVTSTMACINDKMNTSTSEWDAACNNSMRIDITNTTTYDLEFTLGDFRVYAKIANTIEGNSGTSGMGLKKTGVVAANSGEVEVQKFPYLYTLEIDTRNTRNTDEKARISMLYQY